MFMKKTTILSLATAAAIVATSAGTYAAWDSLEASKDTTVTFSKPVEVALNDLSFETTDTLGSTPVASDEITITVTDTESRANTLTIKPAISVSGDSGITIADFDIEVVDITEGQNAEFEDYNTGLSGSVSEGFKDTKFNHSGANTYTVKVIPKEGSKSKFSKSTAVSVSLKASLSKASLS